MNIEVPFEIVQLEKKSYHLVVECIINDKQKGNLIIDTGASKTVLDCNFVEKYKILELKEEEIQSAGLGNNNIDTKIAEIQNFKIGDLKVEQMCVALINLEGINEMYQKRCQYKISGLLGSDFLLKHRACIDYHKKKLIFQHD